MLSIGKVINLTGKSKVTVGTEDIVIAYFTATIQDGLIKNVNYTVQNGELCNNNKTIFEEDRKNFETKVQSYVE